ncbi:uncharacterized protein LOC113324567 [Papaver somniferum]|uniref:uncharacterized protein LOC113324567 n=1 Tax=Papaver somniferum TaxID=3469 RepID=UPI000E6FA9DC|nr:uncharacterized protein LOC113324567 [Papaver somniferum]
MGRVCALLPSTNDYKVVSILYPKEEEEEEEERGHVHVYILGTGKWRYIGLTGHRRVFNYSSGIYANGALFWLHEGNNNIVQESEIVAFDLKGDKFHYIALPRSEDFEYMANYSSPLKLLGGNYNLYLVHSITGGCRTDTWIYKKDNRNNILSHWRKEFSIELGSPFCAKPSAIKRSNAVLWDFPLAFAEDDSAMNNTITRSCPAIVRQKSPSSLH